MDKAPMDAITWNSNCASLHYPHLLQSYQWGVLKANIGWQPFHKIWEDQGQIIAVALILEKSFHIGRFITPLKILYIPKGPLLKDWQNVGLRQKVITDLKVEAIKRNAIFIKIDPDIITDISLEGDFSTWSHNHLADEIISELMDNQWLFSSEQIQFKNSIVLDLTKTEDELLSGMKQKTRYNIRLAQRNGVSIREGGARDLDILYRMYAETSLRDGFAIRGKEYYEKVWGIFLPKLETAHNHGEKNSLISEAVHAAKDTTQPYARIFFAEVNREPVAAIICYFFAGKAWYLFGMSRNTHREKMPNYLLQWEAIRHAKYMGCKLYDFWGAPENFEQSDPLFGLYRFKSGFGGKYVRTIGAWDMPIKHSYYQLYINILPRILNIMRIRGKKFVSQQLH